MRYLGLTAIILSGLLCACVKSKKEPEAKEPQARPYYYAQALTDDDLKDRSLRDLSLMRNTIYARAGHIFRVPWLKEYFEGTDWYTPKEKPDYTILTDIDKANATRIGELESSHSSQELKRRLQEVHARASSPLPGDAVELKLLSRAMGQWQGENELAKSKRNPLEDPTVLDEQLAQSQLENLSRRDLRLIRNTIFARHGRAFKSDTLQYHFGSVDWYEIDKNYSDKALTDIDKRNIKLVLSVEKTHGGPMSEAQMMEEMGWGMA